MSQQVTKEKYSIETLRERNVSYDHQHWLTQEDVDMANSYVELIERTVSVYDVNGQLIKEYSGKFDIETDRESYILFDDEDGNRHMIYYTTGTIIVDEK